ncbi:hypothetical protein RvY_00772 [Ramazzottius varieornatus]|uniref:Uncharacterized protein n=1 Tax=Ramazzottius varieornatus TaxID=947166 RepID=A0A1D1UED6_RAMVA|nr:hypothetical protein RvY_00772 [Ramazzottius varieornatus]
MLRRASRSVYTSQGGVQRYGSFSIDVYIWIQSTMLRNVMKSAFGTALVPRDSGVYLHDRVLLSSFQRWTFSLWGLRGTKKHPGSEGTRPFSITSADQLMGGSCLPACFLVRPHHPFLGAFHLLIQSPCLVCRDDEFLGSYPTTSSTFKEELVCCRCSISTKMTNLEHSLCSSLLQNDLLVRYPNRSSALKNAIHKDQSMKLRLSLRVGRKHRTHN